MAIYFLHRCNQLTGAGTWWRASRAPSTPTRKYGAREAYSQASHCRCINCANVHSSRVRGCHTPDLRSGHAEAALQEFLPNAFQGQGIQSCSAVASHYGTSGPVHVSGVALGSSVLVIVIGSRAHIRCLVGQVSGAAGAHAQLALDLIAAPRRSCIPSAAGVGVVHVAGGISLGTGSAHRLNRSPAGVDTEVAVSALYADPHI